MNNYTHYIEKIHIKNIKSILAIIRIPNLQIYTRNKLSIKEQTFFAKRLSFLIRAGVPLLEGMILIGQQTRSQSHKRMFEKISSDISNGYSLATSLQSRKGIFGNFTINIIKSGESSGTLVENLAYLADELRKKEILRKKILGAMLYPLIVTIATFGITGLLTMYIFPKILPIFQGLSARLPWSTRTLLSLSYVLRNYWLFILVGITSISIALIVIIRKRPRVRFIFDGLILRAPLIGKIVKNYNLTTICRTLGLLLKSGIPITEALRMTIDTTENTQYQKFFTATLQNVLQGKSVSLFMASFPGLIPPMLGHMIAVGEKSGNLSQTFIYLSEFYENEFEDLTKNLSSALEPILMIVMGLMVGFVALSVITPIYEITNTLKR